MEAFINAVEAQRGNNISTEDGRCPYRRRPGNPCVIERHVSAMGFLEALTAHAFRKPY